MKFWRYNMDKKDELKSLLDIYNILKKDESEYNLYKDSKILTKLIEKTEEQLKELENE